MKFACSRVALFPLFFIRLLDPESPGGDIQVAPRRGHCEGSIGECIFVVAPLALLIVCRRLYIGTPKIRSHSIEE